ncbi:MAG TPA: PQQ-binding-like beta-propeller repeat protein [Verrucomicrobiales bacterium]|nr:PQQ-binding-like beta-propeller repeat protein [Verrucomicrobiales bacterium]
MDRPRPRWWLLALFTALPFALLLILRNVAAIEESGVNAVLTIGAFLLVFILIVLWLLAFSRLPAGHRIGGLLVLGLLAAFLAASIRVSGHWGDFLPQLAWRWSPDPAARAGLPALPPTSAIDAAEITTSGPADFPQFLGPDRDNRTSGALLPPDWSRLTPRERWRRDVGLGWSSFAVAGPLIFTQEQRGDEEWVLCYDIRDGSPVWGHSDPVRFSESMGGDGPRATPSVYGGRVYALGATGILNCFEAATGALLWSRRILEETNQPNLEWAKSSSPLAREDRVVVSLGDSKEAVLAAYHAETGHPLWQSGSGPAAYASPVPATLAGRDQILSLNGANVSGHDPSSGSVLWEFPLPSAPAHVASPVPLPPNRLLIAIGYGAGSRLLELQPGPANPDSLLPVEIWHSLRLKPKFADLVVHGAHAYGLDEGRLVCIDLATGDRPWKGSRFGHGQILGVEDHLIIQCEDGDVAIANLNPESERVTHRFNALRGKTWNHPVLAGRLLLLRNDREAICFEYPTAP